MNAVKHNRIRKLILEALSPNYPSPVDTLIVRQTLSNMGYPMANNDLTAYLAYLNERGFVSVEEKKDYGITLVAITADGLDVLDGRLDDRGVGIAL